VVHTAPVASGRGSPRALLLGLTISFLSGQRAPVARGKLWDTRFDLPGAAAARTPFR